MTATWPLRTKASLVEQFVGKSLHDIPLPAAVLDIAKIKRNCNRMLETVEALGFDFLPAISYHRVGVHSCSLCQRQQHLALEIASLSSSDEFLLTKLSLDNRDNPPPAWRKRRGSESHGDQFMGSSKAFASASRVPNQWQTSECKHLKSGWAKASQDL